MPILHGVKIPPNREKVAAFLVGGLVFGAYAQASGADHLLQPKRSRLLAALTAPSRVKADWSDAQEQKLFASLRQHCVRSDNINASVFRNAPTIVPYLLSLSAPPAVTPIEPLVRCLDLRSKRIGDDYREWYKRLRAAWSLGHRDVEAEESVRVVLRKLAKLNTMGIVTQGTRVEFGAGEKTEHQQAVDDDGKRFEVSGGLNVGIFQAGIGTDVVVRIPHWLRSWSATTLSYRPHRRLLLRMSIRQATRPAAC